LAKLDQAALDVIIAQHKLYRESKPNGRQASIIRQDLTGLVFCGCDLSYADFSGSILYEADLEFATLDFCVFFGCDLRKANFRNARMQRTDLRGAALRGAIMSNADLTNADLREGSFATYDKTKGLTFSAEKEAWQDGVGHVDLRGANMHAVRLSGAVAMNSDFEDANLSNARVSGANLRGANLSGAMLDYSSLVNVDMTGALTDKPAGKALDALPLPLDQMLALHAVWLDTVGIKGQRLDLGGYDMRDAPPFHKINLTMLLADHSVWYAHDLSGANMQASHFAHSDLRSCHFESADLRGSNFYKANLVGSKFKHTRLDPLLLNDKRFLKTSFAGANLRYTDFTNAVLSDINFTGADLSFADFSNAQISNCTFHDVTMEETKISPDVMTSKLTIIKEQTKT
jgi:uncharacterized protein YjbI with pentapeptide repeats